MPGTANLILLPLDALGASGKKYGSSSRDSLLLPPLSASGNVYQHSYGTLVLPMITSTFTMDEGEKFSLNRALPQLVVYGRFGMTANLTLPMLTFAGTATFPIISRGTFKLPMLTVAGNVIVGMQGTANLILPQLVVSMTVGSHGEAVLPMIVVAGSVSTREASNGAIILPLLRTTGTISVTGYGFAGAITLPMLEAGPYGSARITLPMLQVLGVELMANDAELAFIFEGWLLNTRNGYITRITNFPFTHFTSVGNKTYAVGAGGIYLLGGDLDAGAPINWQFETGLDDLGKPGVKHIPYLYLDGIIDGVVQIALIDDRNRVFAYEYSTKQRGAIHLPHRRKLGNGIRTRSMAFRISSDSGAYIELDALEPQITVTQRSIG